LMSFLYYFLQDYNPTDSNFVDSIWWSVNYTEGFEIYIYQKINGKSKIIFKFRNIEKEVDQIKLKEFCMSEVENPEQAM
jgi:hypothetical protein